MRTRLVPAILSCFAITSFLRDYTARTVIRGTVQEATVAVIIDVPVSLLNQMTKGNSVFQLT